MAAPAIQQPAITAALGDIVGRCRDDPRAYIWSAWPWGAGELADCKPRAWQDELYAYITERLAALKGQPSQVIKVARATGHDPGKSAAMSKLALWAIGTGPGTRGLITANTEQQLRNKTWPELEKWYRLWLFKDYFQCTATSVQVKGESARNWRIDRETWSEHNTEAFQGLHNKGKRLVVLMDESSAIDRKVCEATEGSLTDEYTQILWILFGNPTRNKGYFFDVFHRWHGTWNTAHIDSRDVEGTNKEELQRQVDQYGEDSDFARVRVKGQFPRVSDRQFISHETVRLARERHARCMLRDPFWMGVDVARGGLNSRSVIAFRKGFDARTHPWITYRGRETKDLEVLAYRVIEEAKRYYPDAIGIDGDGVGALVVKIVRDAGLPVIECRWGTAATDPKRWGNKRIEAWGAMRDDLERGLAIPDEQELEDDLVAPEYHYLRKSDAMVLTSKEDLERSTDLADALACTYYHWVAPRANAGGPLAGYREQMQVDYDPIEGPPVQAYTESYVEGPVREPSPLNRLLGIS